MWTLKSGAMRELQQMYLKEGTNETGMSLLRALVISSASVVALRMESGSAAAARAISAGPSRACVPEILSRVLSHETRCADCVERHGLGVGGQQVCQCLRLRGGAASSFPAGPPVEVEAGGAGRAMRRQLTVLLVAMALFNDMLQLSMLTPIIPSLIASPPPLGVSSNGQVAMGLLFASKDFCQLSAAPIAAILISHYSSRIAEKKLSKVCAQVDLLIYISIY